MVKKRKKRFSWKLFWCFIIYEIFFMIASAPILIFYGPFDNVKKQIVATAMGTMTHQWIATTFLSKSKIDKILGKDTASAVSDSQSLNQVKISNGADSTITRYDIPGRKFDAYMLEIKNPKRLKIGMTKTVRKLGQRTSQIAEQNGAIAAVNAGGFNDSSPDGKTFAGNGAFPTGVVISDGKVLYSDLSATSKTEMIGLTGEGLLVVGSQSTNQLLKMGVKEAVSFSPSTLIVNGKKQPVPEHGINPRTAIGQKKDGTILLLVIDGIRGTLRPGASLEEVREILFQNGAWNAANLDGGSSTTMYYNGDVINSPGNWNGERTISTVFYVKQ